MEDVKQQREITRLVAGPNATQVTFEDTYIQANKHCLPPDELLIQIRRTPLTFRDTDGKRYLITDAWVQDDEVSVVVKGHPI